LFEELATKRFVRSAADKEVKDPAKLRPPIILNEVINFLRDCIADQDRVP
jgi:hypothetical protein